LNLFTIPSDVNFVEALAARLWDEAAGDPLRLSDGLVLLPTRRACRVLRDAFLRIAGGKAVLLPKLEAVGDAGEEDWGAESLSPDLPPAIPVLRRTLLLATLIGKKDPTLPFDQTVELARALGALLDEVQTNERDFADLPKLVEGELAEHWKLTLDFLEILTKQWPVLLAAEGCLDPAARRSFELDARVDAWTRHPPSYPVLAAGSTASIPAVARLLKCIAGLPLGRVVLPALDRDMDAESWDEVQENHPQYGMKKFLELCGTKRSEVDLWSAAGERPARARLWREALRPPKTTEAWRKLTPEILPRDAVAGLSRIEAEHAGEEAEIIALCLRGALEIPEKTAALVTPDRALAERVSVALRRWGIEIDDSAGVSLPRTSLGAYLSALLDAGAPEASGLAYLTLFKNPFAAFGVETAECRERARKIEIACWRGLMRSDGLRGAAETMREQNSFDTKETNGIPAFAGMTEESEICSAKEGKRIAAWLEDIAAAFADLQNAWDEKISFAERLALHLALAEKGAAQPSVDGAAILWRGSAGEAAATFFDQLKQAAFGLPALDGDAYRSLLTGLFRGVTIRPAYGGHQRLSILGPLEARLWHPDLVILGGMNEGVWPPAPPVDPWLSRPMKRAFGLPLPERRVGLSAHDLAQLGCVPEVLLTRARRVEGAPKVPSRFLLQLEAVLLAAYGAGDHLAPPAPFAAWARELDAPDAIKPCDRPAPCPPADARPRALSVTDIGAWQRNPYALYAKRILKLKKLDALEEDISAADFGNLVHAALERFIKATMEKWPEDPLPLLLEAGREALEAFADRPEAAAFWEPRFARLAAWFVDFEAARRKDGIKPCAVEGAGVLRITESFRLTGRADRIDLLPDGHLSILDYKTGEVPSGAEVARGIEPQLPLLALMAMKGGFENLAARDVGRIGYLKLSGGAVAGEEKPVKADVAQLAEEALAGLQSLIARYADPMMPYRVAPRPALAPEYDDYAHLSRQKEWGQK
jgi:ATP-dependent helicase/nuclease subunit B